MKTKPIQNMISNRMLLICILALPLSFSACKKDNDTTISATAEDAGTVMAQAVDPETGGLVLQTEASANFALTANNSLVCGVRKDSSIAGAFNGTNRSFEYSLSLSRLLSCSGSTPSAYEHSFTGSASYSVPAVSSDGNITGSFAVTGLGTSSSQLSLDQTYTYTGVQQRHTGMQRSLTSTVTIQSSGVKVDKVTRQIVSGTAIITATGIVSTGEAFSYTGTLAFLGGRKARLVVSGGATYNIQW